MPKNNNKTKETYVLGVGEKGQERLDILNKVYGPRSRQFLFTVDAEKAKKIASVGCGTGNMEIWLAQTFEDAEVLAIDASEEQLKIGEERASQKGVKNVSFLLKDVYNFDYEKQFDLVYCRFLLIHLKDPISALRNLIRSVKPGGFLIIEEIQNNSMFVYPENTCFAEAVALVEKIGELQQVDYNLGCKLHTMLYENGMKDIVIESYQPVYAEGSEKTLFSLSIKEAASRYIEENITSPKELQRICQELDKINGDPKSIVGMTKVFQVRARIPNI